MTATVFNRDASLILYDPKAAAYFEKIFLYDWDNRHHASVPTEQGAVVMLALAQRRPRGRAPRDAARLLAGLFRRLKLRAHNRSRSMATPARTTKSKLQHPEDRQGQRCGETPQTGQGLRTKQTAAGGEEAGRRAAGEAPRLADRLRLLPAQPTPRRDVPEPGGLRPRRRARRAVPRRRLGLTDNHLIKLTSTDTGGQEPKEPPDLRPTYENMVHAFRRLTEMAARGDQVYIHYSGHGGRSPTIVPRLKGPNGLDESLVPIDIGNSSAHYLRNVEIARLLKGLVDKGLVVTVVFDCCHSGGAARAAVRAETDMAVRGVTFVDCTPRPTDSLVGNPEELAAAWGAPVGEARGEAATRDLMTQAGILGYTLLAACRPSESAYEAVFEGTKRNGTLTFWWLQACSNSGPGLTYRMVYDRVLAQVHSRFSQQTPLLQGEADRVIFGTCELKPELAAPVLSVAADGKSVRLEAGEANLVRPGSHFAIYPNDTLDLAATERRIAVVRVRAIGGPPRPRTSSRSSGGPRSNRGTWPSYSGPPQKTSAQGAAGAGRRQTSRQDGRGTAERAEGTAGQRLGGGRRRAGRHRRLRRPAQRRRDPLRTLRRRLPAACPAARGRAPE